MDTYLENEWAMMIRGILEGYYKLYPFLSQILETDLNVTEKLYKNS